MGLIDDQGVSKQLIVCFLFFCYYFTSCDIFLIRLDLFDCHVLNDDYNDIIVNIYIKISVVK